MNVTNNADFHSGSVNMADFYQQRDERLIGTTQSFTSAFSAEPSVELERCHSLSYRSMHEHRTKESNQSFKSHTLQNMDDNAEGVKVQPYRYTTARRPCCTDDVLIAPTTELPMPPSVLQHSVRQEPTFHRNLLEVGNDLIPMSGVDETSSAHKKGQTIDTACVACDTVLFCLDTASLVVCPCCRFISPMESHSTKKLSPTINVHAGIGLPIDFVLTLE